MRSAQLHAWNSSHLLINTARIAGAMHFWAVLWNIPDPSSKENYPALMIWPGSNLHSSLFFFLFFPSSQGLMEVCKYFEPPSPLRFHKLCFQALEGTVVNAMWLTDSHFPDSGSDWSSPAPAIRLQSTRACIPFSFSPLLFPSVAHLAGSGFWALCLDCMQ